MAEPSVLIERPFPGVARIRLAQPERMNVIDLRMRDDLLAAVQTVLNNPEVRAIILTGEGGNFSAGGDIEWMRRMAPSAFRAYHRDTIAIARLLATADKPTIAAIEGVCIGGGAGFALCCDYVLMAQGARFGMPFLRIGLVPDMGSFHLLARRLGLQGARRFIFDGAILGAAEAARQGLADHVHADDAVQDEAEALALRLAAMPRLALAQTKWLMGRAEVNFSSFLEDELQAQAPCLGGSEFLEGCTAFLEKRPPKY
ncbi:enoyl-CoA hydratase/isomerase family protein [Phenylobacterium sp.]|uniref:enoyl-CoA hydratase/isomerase family protein n=1 Tax=Phenylobacterium sp. TaxID=1871053 RepID=UPI0035B206F7